VALVVATEIEAAEAVGGVAIEEGVGAEMGAAAAAPVELAMSLVTTKAIAMKSLTTTTMMANLAVRHRAAALDPESLAEYVQIRPVYPVICSEVLRHRHPWSHRAAEVALVVLFRL
jgi:hypothetical protein